MEPVSPRAGAAVRAAGGPGTPAPVAPLWKSIAGLRGLAMCLVVANHAIQKSGAAFLTAYPSVTPRETPWGFATILVLRALTPVCLVAFFFASGFMAFRFSPDPRSSRAAAAQVARKYLLWSVAMLAAREVIHRRLSWREAGTALVLGSAQEAYWFLVVLVVLLLSAPVWTRLARTRATRSFLAVAAMQIAACAFFYLWLEGGDELSTLEIFLLRPLQFLPAFIAGMWVSRNAMTVSTLVARHRPLLAALAVAAGAASVAESWLLARAFPSRAGPVEGVFATERASVIVFGILSIAALIGTEARSPRLAGWLRSVGTSSLGIMLLVDVCMQGVMVAVWHVPPLVSRSAAAALAEHRLPPGIAENALWLTPVLFAAGMWGPLWIMAGARRLLGNRVRYLW